MYKNFENIDDEQYDKLRETFNIKNFRAEKLVLLAENSGMGYITFTARHYDGFLLYDRGKLSSYNSINTPENRDFVKEVRTNMLEFYEIDKRIKKIKHLDNGEEICLS